VKSEILWTQARIKENADIFKEDKLLIIDNIESSLDQLDFVVSDHKLERLSVLSKIPVRPREGLRRMLKLKISDMQQLIFGFGLRSKDQESIDARLKEVLEELEEFKKMIAGNPEYGSQNQ
jgi:hypothetical protein